MADKTLEPSARPVDTSRAPTLTDFKLNGTAPFWSHANSADQRIEEAHAILLTLSGAFASADDAKEGTPGEVRPAIVAQALQGIATLIALAQHHADVHAFETRRKPAIGSVQ